MSHSIDNLTDAKNALRSAESALQQALDLETKLVSEQQQRLAELAHEIRTPLNAVIGYAQMISEEVLGTIGNPAYKDHAKTIHHAGLHLMQVCDTLVGEFLEDDSLSESSFSEVDAGEIIGGVVNLFSWMAKERGITLEAEMDADFPKLRTDSTRLNQILINLVSNAIKYTPKGGKVGIHGRFDVENGAMILIVQDDGTGISEADLLKVRQPFERGSTASPHGDEGTGLGLSIAGRLVQELSGKLEISSEEGAGTMVVVTLPVFENRTVVKEPKSRFNPFS
ncbi:MAG: HAMP domain-containing histidine kinase [Rhodospirillales bacterium]|nr:HAMP domain-containing histidine kinase [Rhodospirillales bacterium]